jgi:hypothetical protein
MSFSQEAQQAQLWSLLQELLGRHSSDDFLYIYLVLINQYVVEVSALPAAGGPAGAAEGSGAGGLFRQSGCGGSTAQHPSPNL